MTLKQLSYWRKGAIIASIIFIILFILLLFIPPIGCNTSIPLPEGQMYENCSSTNLSELLLLPSFILLDFLDIDNDFVVMLIAFLTSLIIYLIIGALSGLLIGKLWKWGQPPFS